MNIRSLEPKEIDHLKELQPEGWSDIRPYFYFYTSSGFCDPVVIIENGNVLAVGTTIRHQNSAWLAHVIVHPDHRNKGLGKIMTSALVERLDKQKYKTIYLDATDMGYPVYKKLGFEIEANYIHLDGKHTDQYLLDPVTVIPYHDRYRNALLEMDQSISGEDRLLVLSDHLVSSLLYVSDGELYGAYFSLLLEGFVLAVHPAAGTELMKLRMRTRDTFRFPAENQAGIDFLLANGFREVRTSKRMILGEKREWNGKGIFNRISGGLG